METPDPGSDSTKYRTVAQVVRTDVFGFGSWSLGQGYCYFFADKRLGGGIRVSSCLTAELRILSAFNSKETFQPWRIN